ncbi:MAG: hypothetical protein LBI72_06130 [Flavobacteriaceae bacterium]|jgi:hypothetical protein|nr:hypothetical protein [Flavobacteriaceae bacterium]
MGWFTSKSKQWEIKVGSICYFAILFPFLFPPIAMVYMGIRGRLKSLLYGSIVWTFLFVIGYYKYFFANEERELDFTLFTILFSGAVVVAIYLQTFLRRVHLASIVNVDWNDKYNYIDFIRREEVNEVLSVDDFINQLLLWQQKIKHTVVRGNIFSMIELTKSITEKKGHISELFIVRHAYSIENILLQYYQIELSKLNNATVEEAKEKIRSTLLLAIKAFENELRQKDKKTHLDIEVDVETYIQDLKNKRLL